MWPAAINLATFRRMKDYYVYYIHYICTYMHSNIKPKKKKRIYMWTNKQFYKQYKRKSMHFFSWTHIIFFLSLFWSVSICSYSFFVLFFGFAGFIVWKNISGQIKHSYHFDNLYCMRCVYLAFSNSLASFVYSVVWWRWYRLA